MGDFPKVGSMVDSIEGGRIRMVRARESQKSPKPGRYYTRKPNKELRQMVVSNEETARE